MADQNVQETLDRILAELKSGESERVLSAIQEIETISFSSEAIVRKLEKLALQKTGTVREAALRALSLQSSQFVASKRSNINKPSREIILREIDALQENGLIEQHHAEVIRRQYDFDIKPGISIGAASSQSESESKSSASVPAPIATSQTKTAEARPSLTQILLSENSIRIYLYLGAFFVISSAAILAALIEIIRLPLLFMATLIFAGGAIGLKKRLPQPSFALAVVFSFLLLIDANVFSDLLNLNLRANDFYWMGILLLMMFVWGLGTWFYESRMFSIAAFLAFAFSILRFNNAVNAPAHWAIFSIGFVNILGLIAFRILQALKDKKFAQPLFITAQASQIIVLIISLSFIGINSFGSDVSSGEWSAHLLTWLFAASFFAVSDLLIPFILFPWMAVASLFFIPNLFLSIFDASASMQIAGFGIWGALMAFGSEVIKRVQNIEIQKYHYPLLTMSVPLMSTSVLWGLTENNQTAFIVLLGMGATYLVVNILRARWYVWSVALLALLGAYFLFFTLPLMQKTDVHFGYQLLIASILLLTPELFMKELLTFKRSWNWPPVVLGILFVSLNLLITHTSVFANDISFSRATIILGVYTVFFVICALKYKKPVLGYLSTASTALTIYYALNHFEVEAWLPIFTGLSLAYYIVGFFIRKNSGDWSTMFRYSGLGLGTLISLAAPFQSGGIEKAIPIAIVATLFAVDAFQARNVWLALPANGLYLISYFTLLVELDVDQPQYFSIGAALMGMLMHYLLTRAESKTGAFIMGTISQLVLLGTSYVQLVSTSQIRFFFVLFFQSLVIIFYGLYMRSRSLVFAPIAIVVLATLTILYSALQEISVVIIIGVSGLILLTLGILAVLMREKITSFAERFSEWNS